MKYLFITLMLQILALSAEATTFTSRIHSIDEGEKGEPHLIMLTNGRTAFLDSKNKNKSLLDALKASLENEETIELKLDQKLNLVSVETVNPQSDSEEEQTFENEMTSEKAYEPSIITSAQATTVFKNMRRDYQKESQCYNRAHIWNYEEFKRTGIKSGKLFLFFTSRYIRNYRYHWWFHVTPIVYVGGVAQSHWRALDRRYTSGPLTTKTWTDVFMLNNAFCPLVPKYSDYRNHQQSQDCYLIHTSMYYWQPWEIRKRETSGYMKNSFINSQINHAYWEAF